MKVILEIADKDADVGMKVLKGHYFVKKIKKMSSIDDLRKDLQAAAREVRLAKKGKIKLQPAREFLNELRSRTNRKV